MNLEPIIQSKVSQKNKSRIYMESREMVLMKLFAGLQWRRKHRDQTCRHSEGKERVGRIERGAWKHIHYHT